MKFHRLLGAFLLTMGISTAASTSVAANEESAGGLQVMSQSLITQNNEVFDLVPVSYTHLTLPTTPYE